MRSSIPPQFPAVRSASGHGRPSARGFTLIELLIAMVILSIITAVALPSYTDYVKRGKLTDAFNQLTSLSMSLEQYYQDNRTYLGACGTTGNAQLPAATAYFTMACPTLTATGYTIQATGVAGSATAGFQYTLDQSGARTTPAAPTGWSTSTACWVNNRGGNCQ